MYSLGIRAAIALDEQDERAAEALSGDAMEVMHQAELDEHPWAALSWIVHGALLGRHGDLGPAEEAIARGIAFGERLRAWQLTAYGSLALAEVRQRQHEPAAARRLLTRVRDILETLPDPGTGLAGLEQTEKMLREDPHPVDLHEARRELAGRSRRTSARARAALRRTPRLGATVGASQHWPIPRA